LEVAGVAVVEFDYSSELARRVDAMADAWRVEVASAVLTPSSAICFGSRDGREVVLKVVRAPGDEWHSGEVLAAFGGRGIVAALEHAPGALLMPRLVPALPLARLVLDDRDEEATTIIGHVIRTMQSVPARATAPGVEEWGRSFDRYLASGDRSIDNALVVEARDMYDDLCATQGELRLLHGDLQHYNVVRDDDRGWTAIDPKGVVGELEYELGASLRNPIERPDLFASRAIVERRLALFASVLDIDVERARRWAFTQGVLSAVWSVEDGEAVEPSCPSLVLAGALRGV
jgi:streptomycin 6-kinase